MTEFEHDWLTSKDPQAMLRFLSESSFGPDGLKREDARISKPSDRRFRLYALAAARLTPAFERYNNGSVVAESIASVEDCVEAGQHNHNFSDSTSRANRMYWSVCRSTEAAQLMAVELDAVTAADLAREIFGNPFRPVRLHYEWTSPEKWPEPTWTVDDVPSLIRQGAVTCPWLTPTVLALAQVAYDERLPSGALNAVTLAVLSDALEDAGCDDEGVLRHLRGEGPGIKSAGAGGASLGRTPYRISGWRPLTVPHFRGCAVLDAILSKE